MNKYPPKIKLISSDFDVYLIKGVKQRHVRDGMGYDKSIIMNNLIVQRMEYVEDNDDEILPSTVTEEEHAEMLRLQNEISLSVGLQT